MSEFKEQESGLRNLLSDDEFVALMQAEHDRQRPQYNELEKQRIWNTISQQVAQNRQGRNWWSYAAVAMLALVVLPVVLLQMPTEDITRSKGASGPGIVLHAYVLQSDNSLRRVEHSVGLGDTLVFKAGVTEASTAGIVLQENDGERRIRFVSEELAPGMDQLVLRGEKTYGFKVEDYHQRLSVCALAVYDPSELESVDLENTVFKANQCVLLTINK